MKYIMEQDRTAWERELISEGVALVTATLSRGSIGVYQIQAAIAAVHDEATRAEDTDWPQVTGDSAQTPLKERR